LDEEASLKEAVYEGGHTKELYRRFLREGPIAVIGLAIYAGVCLTPEEGSEARAREVLRLLGGAGMWRVLRQELYEV